MTDKETPEARQFQAEVQQLLHILAHSLYTNREIFLRELVSNASDALNRLKFEMLTNRDVQDPEIELAIRITVDKEAGTIVISDTGIGMSREDLIQNLGTIAHSGAAAFLHSVADQQRKPDDIIGQFGVGFYSVFMVAEEVTVTSRSFLPEDHAWSWTSRGDNTYTLVPAEKAERGTTITIKLNPEAEEFADAWRLEQIVKKHSDYVPFPIYVENKVVNRQTALWRQSPQSVESDQYDDFYKQLTLDFEKPMLHLHLVADAPVEIRSILYVPSRREQGALGLRADHGLKLYTHNVLIQEQTNDLLPDYLRFVDGVVDSEDLPLNISRETVQSNPMMRQIRRTLAGRLLKELSSMADEKPEDYQKFWDEFGIFIKEGIVTNTGSQSSLADLLRFFSTSSSQDGVQVSLKDYVSRLKPNQEAIYYILGADLKSARRSPHLDFFRTNDIEVLLLVDPLDAFLTTTLANYEGKPLQNVDDPDLSLPEIEQKEDTQEDEESKEWQEQVVQRFRTVLGDQVTDVRVSRQLTDSPCRLITPELGPERDMQRVRRLLGQENEIPKKLLEINLQHPLIQNLGLLLENQGEASLVDAVIQQMYENVLLVEGLLSNPADMTPRIETLMNAALNARLGK